MSLVKQTRYAVWPEPVGEHRLKTYVSTCKRIDECEADIRALSDMRNQRFIGQRIVLLERTLRQLYRIIDQTDKALSELSDYETRVIYGLYFDHESPAYLAHALECSPSRIESLRKSALHKLDQALTPR